VRRDTWSVDRRDSALGAAVQAALTPADDGADFVAQVCERAAKAGVGSWDAVLGRWSRRAIAAAAVAALVAGFLVGGLAPAASLDAEWVTAATGSASAAALLTPPGAPDVSALFNYTAAN